MKKIALVIGHSERSQGAVNQSSGLTEWRFNDMLAAAVEVIVDTLDVFRIYRNSYQDLPLKINLLNPDYIISLHCNAFNQLASGTETLFYHRSETGKTMAEIVNRNVVAALGLPNRGVKPKTSEDRGGYLLRYTNAPCVIAEPFFIDNDSDLVIAKDKYLMLIDAMAKSVLEIAEL